MKKIQVNEQFCPKNHYCPAVNICPVGAILQDSPFNAPRIDGSKCIKCGKCANICNVFSLAS